MNAPTSNSQFAFQLPNLSYVDTSLEEPNLRDVMRPTQPRQGFGAWLRARRAAFAAGRNQAVARAELGLMSDRELTDIGLNRGDLDRMFLPAHNRDLMHRRGAI